MSSKISIEQLMNTSYIKYNNMIEIINSAFVGSKAESLNLYVDLYSILKPLYKSDVEIVDYTIITSCIINLCAHYRAFFRQKYKVETAFYLVYSKNCGYINNQYYPEYNKKNEFLFNTNKLIDDMINNNLNLLETLCPYLPDIHFIKGTFETGVIMYDLICRSELNNNDPHIILTKDIYNYQLVPSRNNVIILRPKKANGQDVSYYINQNNLLNIYLKERKCKHTNQILMPSLLSLIMALSSVHERNIKSLLNITSVFKLLEESVSYNKILNGYNTDLSILYDYICKVTNNFKTGFDTINFRFRSVDIMFQHSAFINTPECKSIVINNLDDPMTVKDINNKYFINNPLDLERL